MSKNALVVSILALIVAVGALILPFVIPGEEGAGTVDLSSVEQRLEALESAPASGLRVGYVNITDVAQQAFYPLAEDERSLATSLSDQRSQLQGSLQRGEISETEYVSRSHEIRAQLLRAQVGTLSATLGEMLRADGLMSSTDRVTALQMQEAISQYGTLIDQLLSMVLLGTTSAEVLESNINAAESQFQAVDGLVTQLVGSIIGTQARAYAIEGGFDLVLVEESSLIFGDPSTTEDISGGLVERIAAILE
ncbi:hypothetical protein JW848_06990 [Candidatus Bipolaricaulota bacterium]|nr:hypothetical protein [Candidatus Bipolaricaulota bacterium]